MRSLLFITCLLSYGTVAAQVLVPIAQTPEKINSTNNAGARTMAAVSLPFWDDFSSATTAKPLTDLWFAGRSVWVNTGLGINPPSIKVATFDGIDSLGRTYSANAVLAKGFADKLESQPILMEEVDPSARNTVYLSFFYQIKGRGELPDLGDILTLWFRDNNGNWEQVWSHENKGTEPTTQFTHVIVPVTDPKWFHNGFQFKFQNFARLSGPYDTWHVDYIYLNKGRSATDLSFPDRTITAPLTHLFGLYNAVPIKHLRREPSVMSRPSLTLNNMRLDQVPPDGQVVNYFTNATVVNYKGGVPATQNITLDVEAGLPPLIANQPATFALNTIPSASTIDAESDSAFIKLNVSISTGDNVLPPPVDDGDYDEARYAPIDFRHSDTTSGRYMLTNYYAYDDGEAEYGAGLNQPGAQIAYEFNLVGVETENITNVGFYFPRFGDESSQVIELRIWNSLSENAGELLYSEVINVTRTSNNEFIRRTLTKPVPVGKRFYIGWKQQSASVIAVGLDKNNDTGNKIFFNINGSWNPNTAVAGSFMMRPYFGEGIDDVDNGVEDELALTVYPNPSDGTFTVPGRIDHAVMYDITGRVVGCSLERSADETRITLDHPVAGLYVLTVLKAGSRRSAKVVVR